MRLFQTILIGFLLLSQGLLLAQSEPVDLEMISKIRHEGLENSKIRELSFYLTDVIGPRLSGSTGLSNAYTWTSERMAEWGLSNVQVVPWGKFGRGWDNEKFYIAMTKPYYQHMIAIPRSWTRGTDSLIVTPPVLVDIKNDSDYEKYKGKLAGSIVVTPMASRQELSFLPLASRWDDSALEELSRYPDVTPSAGQTQTGTDFTAYPAPSQKFMQFLEDEGAAALLNPSGAFGSVRSHGRGYDMSVEPGLPVVDMTYEHYGRIVRLLEAGIPVEIEIEIQNRFLENDLMGYNVIAEIPGNDPELKEEVVMIGGHLDSWHGATGGNDNAAGVAVMMEVMRIFNELAIQPRRTIRIALWGGEEQGLFGSRGYVREHFYDPANGGIQPGHELLSAYYNVDNGSGMIRGIYLQGNDSLRPIFDSWFEPLRDIGVSTTTLRRTGSTDHVPFDGAGLPGFQFIQDRLDYNRGYHTNMDTFERMQLDDMKQAATVVAVLVYHTAMREEKLPRKVFTP